MFSFLGMLILNVKFSLGNIFGITNLRNKISNNKNPQHHQYAKIDIAPNAKGPNPSLKNSSSVGGGNVDDNHKRYTPTSANII